MTVTPEEYGMKLREHWQLRVDAIGDVRTKPQWLYASKQNVLVKPPLLNIRVSFPDFSPKIQGPPTAEVKTPVTFTITFVNPLDIQLTKCTMFVEGVGLSKRANLWIDQGLGPYESIVQKCTVG